MFFSNFISNSSLNVTPSSCGAASQRSLMSLQTEMFAATCIFTLVFVSFLVSRSVPRCKIHSSRHLFFSSLFLSFFSIILLVMRPMQTTQPTVPLPAVSNVISSKQKKAGFHWAATGRNSGTDFSSGSEYYGRILSISSWLQISRTRLTFTHIFFIFFLFFNENPRQAVLIVSLKSW